MDLDEIMRTLRAFIVQRYAIPADDPDFTDDVHLFDYGYVDSFGAIDLIAFGETTFGITISQDDLVAHPLNTIREIARFVQLRREGTVHA